MRGGFGERPIISSWFNLLALEMLGAFEGEMRGSFRREMCVRIWSSGERSEEGRERVRAVPKRRQPHW